MSNCPGAEMSRTGAELSWCRNVSHRCRSFLVPICPSAEVSSIRKYPSVFLPCTIFAPGRVAQRSIEIEKRKKNYVIDSEVWKSLPTIYYHNHSMAFNNEHTLYCTLKWVWSDPYNCSLQLSGTSANKY